METYLLNTDPPMVFVDPEDGSPLQLITPGKPQDYCWTLPSQAEQLWTLAEAVAVIEQALQPVKLSKAARATVQSVLDSMTS